MTNTYHEEAKQKLVGAITAVLVIAGLVLYVDRLQLPGPMMPVAAGQTPVTAPATAILAVATPILSFKDGTYTTTSNYLVPHDMESIKVTLSLSDGTVSKVAITNQEGNPDSARYQQDFARVYQNYVVGRKISDLHLSTIAGASGTTRAFDAALRSIELQARA